MPRYFFHLIHPTSTAVRDNVGLIFGDDATAKREGMRSVAEMMKEASSSELIPFRVSVQIVREDVGIIDLLTGQLAASAQP